jgi:hypothetical protein
MATNSNIQMKLKQINFVEKLTDEQKEIVSQIVPYHKISNSGRIHINKLNKHFDSYAKMLEYKKTLADNIGVKQSNILLTYEN